MARRPLLASALTLLLGAPSWAQAPTTQPAAAPATQPAPRPVAPAPTPAAPPAPSAPGPAAAPRPERYDPSAYVPRPLEETEAAADRVVARDLDTKVELVQRGNFSLHIGALLQLQGAFYVGNEAGMQLNDAADTEGFRVRRARLAFGGQLLRHVSYYLGVDLKDTVMIALGGDRGSEILDARIAWERFPWAHISVGMDKVPFSTFAMMSSGRLAIIERPLGVTLVAPDRRVGITVSGRLSRGHAFARYAGGVYNGSDGVTSGNRMAGTAAAGYLQLGYAVPTVRWEPEPVGVTLSGGYMYDDGPAVNRHKASGSLALHGWLFRVTGELLWEKVIPDAQPAAAPASGTFSRWGLVGEVTAFLWRNYLQAAFRYEYFRDNDQLPTFGKQQLLSGGINVYLCRDRLKAQLNYIRRQELEGPGVDNDVGLAQLQAMF